jgi:four helix bundle protein
MILQLAHTKLDIFKVSKQVVLSIYQLTKKFPSDEKFAMTSQIRRAATSVHLNIAEGSARKSAKEKCRFYEISRSSLVEVDTVLDLAFELKYIDMTDIQELTPNVTRCFQMLSGMIDYNEKLVK